MYDDISSAPKGCEEDRRGAAGTIFIYKILGAAAEDNMTIDELMMLGERVRSNTRTLGVAINQAFLQLQMRKCLVYLKMKFLLEWAFMESQVSQEEN